MLAENGVLYDVSSTFSRNDEVRVSFFTLRHHRRFGQEGFVPLLVVEFERDDHDFVAVLALKPLPHHEPHVGVDPDPVTVDAHAEGHRGSLLFFGKSVAEFVEVNAVVAVGIEGLDDLRDLGGV